MPQSVFILHTTLPARVVVVLVVVALLVVASFVVEEAGIVTLVVVDVVVLSNPGMMHPGKRRRITITAAYCFIVGYLPHQNKMTSVFAINEA
jgi:hypothetical protein